MFLVILGSSYHTDVLFKHMNQQDLATKALSADRYSTEGTRWQRLYPGYFGCDSGSWEDYTIFAVDQHTS